MDLGAVLPSTQFHISQPDGQFVCVAQELLFKGSMLAYDPTSNEAEWIPVQGTASDLSEAEEASARELSNMVPHDTVEGCRGWTGLASREVRVAMEVQRGVMPRKALQKLLTRSTWTRAMKGALMKTRVIVLSMAHAPQHLARGACAPCTATPQDVTPVVSAGQTSACPRMKVTMCRGMRRMSPM